MEESDELEDAEEKHPGLGPNMKVPRHLNLKYYGISINILVH